MSEQQCTKFCCIRCGEAKPRTIEYFSKVTKGRKDGLCGYCRPCENAIKRASEKKHAETTRAAKQSWKEAHPDYHRIYSANREQIRAAKVARQQAMRERDAAILPRPLPIIDPSLKRCGHCKQEKPRTTKYFTPAVLRKNTSGYCKQCSRAYDKARNAKRKKERATAEKQRYAKHHARIKVVQKAWRTKNPEKLRRKSQINEARRNARERTLPDTFTAAQWARCKQYWGYACVYCGREEGFEWTMSIEHFIALSIPDSPGTVATNILPACHGTYGCCNVSKGNKDAKTWLIEKLGPRQAAKKLAEIATYFARVAGG